MKRFVVLAFALIAAACATPAPEEASVELAIVGARVYPAPGVAPLADATVIVRDGVITQVGPASAVHASGSAQVIDGRGLTVVAGLWNSHSICSRRRCRGRRSRMPRRLARSWRRC